MAPSPVTGSLSADLGQQYSLNSLFVHVGNSGPQWGPGPAAPSAEEERARGGGREDSQVTEKNGAHPFRLSKLSSSRSATRQTLQDCQIVKWKGIGIISLSSCPAKHHTNPRILYLAEDHDLSWHFLSV